MIITRKTFQEKQGKKWIDTDVIDSDIVNILLNDDLIAKYLFKAQGTKIQYQYGKIIITYSDKVRAIYD